MQYFVPEVTEDPDSGEAEQQCSETLSERPKQQEEERQKEKEKREGRRMGKKEDGQTETKTHRGGEEAETGHRRKS